MEERIMAVLNDSKGSSCLMLMATLYTPADLGIPEVDLTGRGIETDHHVTAYYKSEEPVIPRKEVLPLIGEAIGSETLGEVMESLKDPYIFYRVPELFTLGILEQGEQDFLVLKMKEGGEIYGLLQGVNKLFSSEYGWWEEYNPYVTLAELVPGAGRKYAGSKYISRILGESKISFDDIAISYRDGGKDTQWYVTNYHAAERHLRLENERKVR